MFSVRHSHTINPACRASGHFLFEMIISVMMIVAIAVLAFPTYQDFAPEPGIDGEKQPAAADAEFADPASPAEAEASVDIDADPDLSATRPVETAGAEADANEA